MWLRMLGAFEARWHRRLASLELFLRTWKDFEDHLVHFFHFMEEIVTQIA